jgi:anti-anti-sigma factor
MRDSSSPDAFTIERHGDVTVIVPSPAIAEMDSSLIEAASALVIDPLRDQDNPQVVFDIQQLDYFGSVFLALLIRCWKICTAKGGQFALSGASPRARDLFDLTCLDTVWPIYDSRSEAIDDMLAD